MYEHVGVHQASAAGYVSMPIGARVPGPSRRLRTTRNSHSCECDS